MVVVELGKDVRLSEVVGVDGLVVVATGMLEGYIGRLGPGLLKLHSESEL